MGKVRLCEHEATKQQFALKVFRKGLLRRQRSFASSGDRSGDGPGMIVKTSMDKVYGEIAIIRRLCHASCCQAYAIIDSPDVDGKLYIILEYAERGPTMNWNVNSARFESPSTGGTLEEPVALSHSRDALMGLYYLHSLRIAHRDIKPQNLLVILRGELKIADFGVAVDMPEDFIVHGTDGTYCFYSPEMCKTGYSGHDGRKADVWALGITLWAFLFGSVPIYHANLVQLLDAIGEGKLPSLPSVPSVTDACSTFLLRRVLTPDSGDRPLTEALLKDPWCCSDKVQAK